ncbi:DUF6284 family protein [Streptomyces sp. NPDC046832]|uniref:DUF6284 family protein n=1 Tax=Streptomyces sp. NPDC046832 TaxID=3155020 RepID=UPI0033E8084F
MQLQRDVLKDRPLKGRESTTWEVDPVHAMAAVHLLIGAQAYEPAISECAGKAPLIEAELELLDVQIALLDRPASALGARRLRRAANKVLAARLEVANRVSTGEAA